MEEDKLYQEGFNSGYLLTKHRPDLADKILDSINKNGGEYFIGFSNGHDVYILDKIFEQNKEQEKGNSRDMPNKGHGDIEKDK